MSDKDRANLLAIVDSCGKIHLFTASISDAEAFHADEKSFDAVLMNFVVIGEAVSRLSSATTDRYPEVPWLQMKGFRNIVAHNYFGVDAEEVWQIVHDHLPLLHEHVERILQR